MTKHIPWLSLLAIGIATSLSVPACGGDDATDGADGVGDGDGDETSGDGDPGDGDPGDGDPGDGDGDPGDGDGDPGDGDGDPGDGDGDPGDGDGEPGDGDGDPGDGDGEPGDGDGEPQGICGNGVIEAGEACDDGNTENNDGCLASCEVSSCGDGYVNQGVEACDDGVNDGSYGGCAANCMSLAPYCGDGQINGPEDCDDGNDDLADGCLDNCVVTASCLTLIEYDDALPDGAYRIKPPGYNGMPFEVWCDMSSDGGGYTFLKIDAGGQTFAPQAEAECASWGMQLWIPRSVEHKNAGWQIANDGDVAPGGHPDYMRILGIYPNFNGATCQSQPMNSNNQNCQWDASDDGPWYVHNVNHIAEPNGDNNVNQSMYYTWQGNGEIQMYNDIPQGYSSQYFMCDVADKLP